VIFTAPEQQLPAIEIALKTGPLQVTAYASDGKRWLGDGKLNLVDNQVDAASGTIKLKASFDNPDDALWPGLSVTTRLLLKSLTNVVAVPIRRCSAAPTPLCVCRDA
jgi:multidrug efflux system membrane fusion protein